MMEISNHISVVIMLGFFASLIWIFYFWFYQQYRVDATRQEIFAIRDELFDFAAAGKISFNHPGYKMLRRTMNGMIRFTHRINFFTLIVIVLIGMKGTRVKGFHDQLNEAFSGVDSKTREKLDCYLYRMNKAVVKHFIKGSLILMVLVLLAALILIFYKGVGKFKQFIVNNFPGISSIDNEAAIRGGLSSL